MRNLTSLPMRSKGDFQGLWAKFGILLLVILLTMGISTGLALGQLPAYDSITPTTFITGYGTIPGTLEYLDPNVGANILSGNIGSGINSNLVKNTLGTPSTSGNNMGADFTNTGVSINYTNVNVLGGASTGVVATNNQLWISGGTTQVGFGTLGGAYGTDARGAAIGGLSQLGQAINNTVVMKDGTVYGLIMGGASGGNWANGNVTNNKVIMNGGSTTSIFAGANDPQSSCSDELACGGTAQNNEVWINGTSAVSGNVRGGTSTFGDAIGNKVYIQGGNFTNVEVQGGHVRGRSSTALTGINVEDNFVEIYGGASGADITGTFLSVSGGRVETGKGATISRNIVRILNTESTFKKVHGGLLLESSSSELSSATMQNNEVFIYNSTASYTRVEEAYGAYIEGLSVQLYSFGTLSGNLVKVQGGQVTSIVAGAYAAGDINKTSITYNSVILEDGATAHAAYGGGKATTNVQLSSATPLAMSGNSVIVRGATFNELYGAFANGTTTASGNVVRFEAGGNSQGGTGSAAIIYGANLVGGASAGGGNRVNFNSETNSVTINYGTSRTVAAVNNNNTGAGSVGTAVTAAADGNQVNFQSGTNTVIANVYGVYNRSTTTGNVGGYSQINITGGTNIIGDSTYNIAAVRNDGTGSVGDYSSVTISGGTANGITGNVSGVYNISSGDIGNNSSVTISGGTANGITGNVSGVYNTGTGAVGNNSSVTIFSGTANGITGNVSGVYNTGSGAVGTGSSVTISGGADNDITQGVSAVYNAGSGAVGTGSSVTISGGTDNNIGGNVFGVYSGGAGTVGNNSSVTISGGADNDITGRVSGVYVDTGGTGAVGTGSSVTISGGADNIIGGHVSGAYIANTGASIVGGSNFVAIEGGTNSITGNIAGVYSLRSAAVGNENYVTFENTTGNKVDGSLYGAYADGLVGNLSSVTFDGNSGLEIENGGVYGAYSTAGIGNESTVSFLNNDELELEGSVYGANATGQIGNQSGVNFSNTDLSIVGNVYGAYATGQVGDRSSVIFDNLTKGVGVTGDVVAAYSEGQVGNNTSVKFNSGTNAIGGNVYGVEQSGNSNVGTNTTIEFVGDNTSVTGNVIAVQKGGNGNIGGGNSITFGGTSATTRTTVTGNVYAINKTGTTGTFGTGNSINFVTGTNEIGTSGSGGNVIVVNSASAPTTGNTLAFSGGTNTIHGNINANGALNITGGTNTLGDATADTLVAQTLRINSATNNIINATMTIAEGATVQGGGTNTFNGATDIGGDLTLTNGTNTFAAALIVGDSLSSTGGTNTFQGNVAVANDYALSGGTAIFRQALSTDTFSAEGAKGTFDGLVTVTGNDEIILTNNLDPGYNFNGGLSAPAVEAISLTNAKATFKGNLTAELADLTVANGSSLVFNSIDAVQSHHLKSLNVTGTNSTLSFSGSRHIELQLAGGAVTIGTSSTLNIGVTDVNIDGTLNLQNHSVLQINGQSGAHGELKGTQLNINGVVYLDLIGDEADFNNDVPIIDFVNNIYFANNAKFDAVWEEIEVAGDKVFVRGEKAFVKVVNDLGRDQGVKITQNYSNAASLLDQIYAAGDLTPQLDDFTDELVDILLYNPRAAEMYMKQTISEYLLTAPQASLDVALKSQGVVFGRLDNIRTTSGITPPSAGSGTYDNRVWIGGFGSWATQDDKNDIIGYKYRSGGVALGIDHELASTPGLVVGFAASFASGTIDNRDGRGTVDVKTSGIGIYGSYTTETGMFLDGSFAFASSKNEATTAIIAGGSKTADFDTRTIQVGVRLGTIYETGTMTITPSIGVRYIKLNQDGFTERATGGAIAMTYDSLSDNIIDIPLEVRIQGQFQVGANLLTPELRLGWTYAAQNSDSAFSAGFAGTSQRTMFYGVEPSRSSFHAGAGLKVETQGPMDFFANYDLTTNSDFLDHKFSAGLGYQF